MDGGDGIDTLKFQDAATASLATGVANDGGGTDMLTSIENLTGSPYADTLTGDAGSNQLDGLNGADTLDGGGGNDVLVGRLGDDSLTGGAGAQPERRGRLGHRGIHLGDQREPDHRHGLRRRHSDLHREPHGLALRGRPGG